MPLKAINENALKNLKEPGGQSLIYLFLKQMPVFSAAISKIANFLQQTKDA